MIPPPEVIAAFGGDPQDRSFMVKLRKAFCGLAHAPRAWFKDVVQRLTTAGWKQLAEEDAINYEEVLMGKVIGLCGIHVDDFLVGGEETNQVGNRQFRVCGNTAATAPQPGDRDRPGKLHQEIHQGDPAGR